MYEYIMFGHMCVVPVCAFVGEGVGCERYISNHLINFLSIIGNSIRGEFSSSPSAS